jgi:transcription initiation factor IIE alpha subunit
MVLEDKESTTERTSLEVANTLEIERRCPICGGHIEYVEEH